MITNRSPQRVRRPVPVQMSVLYQPQETDWSYSHHASICYFKGKFYAMWSNGQVDEDACGQRVLYCTSSDGAVWSEPEPLFASMPGTSVLTASGFYVYGDTITAYAGHYAYAGDYFDENGQCRLGKEHQQTTLYRIESADGEHWSEPADMQLPIVPNHGPQPIQGGRLIISGNILFPYTDDPSGKTGWTLTGTPPFPYEPLFDDSEGFYVRANNYGRDWACEGSFFQTDDGVIHMLQRTLKKKLSVAESHDNGETWSEPELTEFTDCGSKFHCGRLPDGRFYIVSSPDAASPRCPLVLSISKDGENFDREWIIDDLFRPQRIPGVAKGGIYGYPHTAIQGDSLYIICSVNKEDVHVYRVLLRDLDEQD